MSKIEEFLKSLQGVAVDDLTPEDRAMLAEVLGEEPELPDTADAPVSKSLLAKARDLLNKAMGGSKDDDEDEEDPSGGDKESDEDEDDEDEPSGKGGKKPKSKEKEADEEEDALDEAAALLAKKTKDHEEVKKSMGDTNEDTTTMPSIEEFAKAIVAETLAAQKGTTDTQTEAIATLHKAIETQNATIETLQKSIEDMGSRPRQTVAPFELKKAIDTHAESLGLPAKEAAVETMQKAFDHCRANPDTVPMNKAISSTDVQAVENAYSYNDTQAMQEVAPLIARAKALVGG